jgi:hypothetical protein
LRECVDYLQALESGMGRRSGEFTGRSIDKSVSALRFEYYTDHKTFDVENTCDAT